MNRRGRGAAMAIALLALSLLGWWLVLRREPVDPGLRPGQTERARTRTPPVVSSEPEATDPKSARAGAVELEVALLVVLDEQEWYPQRGHGWWVEIQDYWPRPDEAPWPGLASVDRLEELADALRHTSGGAVEIALDAFLDQAERDGLFELDPEVAVTDPWLALLAMQAHYARTFLDDLEQNGLFGADDAPGFDFGVPLDWAQAIVEAHPEAPVADYARLQLLAIQASERTSQFSPDDTLEVVRDIVRRDADDEVMVEAALAPLDEQWARGALSDPELRGDVYAVVDQASPYVRIGVADRMLGEVLASDPEEGAWWTDLRRQWLDEEARQDEGDGVDQARLRGRLAASGVGAASDWREEMIAAVWRCHREAAFPASTDARARWQRGWADWTWTPEVSPGRCVEGSTGVHAPPDATTVHLQIRLPHPPEALP